MSTENKMTTNNEENEQYEQFEKAVLKRFKAMTSNGTIRTQLFTTTADNLWTIFLDGLPPERRQHYTCRSCEHFVTRLGGLVAIAPSGTKSSVLWDLKDTPAFFLPAVQAVLNEIERSKVDGVYYSSEPIWGTSCSSTTLKTTGQPHTWHHLHVVPDAAMIFRNTMMKNASQAMAEKLEDRGMLQRGLAEFPLEVVQQAHTLLSAGDALYRSERMIGPATWLLNLHKSLKAVHGGSSKEERIWNLIWLAAVTAPTGFTHVRSSMIGTLLEDIAAGLPFPDIKRRFDEKMAPSNYQRAQVAPSAGNIAQAEKVISALKAAGALERRYARLDDIKEFEWRPQPTTLHMPRSSGVFDHITPKVKAAAPAVPGPIPPQQTMTWDKFQRTVLPNALSIEAQVPTSPDRFMALVTATQPDATPILQWDSDEARNPVSWYYATGIDAEIKRRVLGAGGKYEDCDIRASLIWNNRNDLDVHVVTPSREHIYYGAKKSRCGGWLDIDMNVGGETSKPIENIRWAKGMAQGGRYQVYVENYRFHERERSATPFRVELEVSGQVFHFEGVSPDNRTGNASTVMVAEFTYVPGQMLLQIPMGVRASQEGNNWNLTAGQWAKITGVVESPNMWGKTKQEQHGRHMFFLLEGCRDMAEGVGRGFFVETLHGEFRPIRSTLEAYTATTAITGGEDANACGIGMSYKAPWDLVLRVTTKEGALMYKIDRWD